MVFSAKSLACIGLACVIDASAAMADGSSVWLSSGVSQLKAREIVYIPSERHKLSELTWKTDSLVTLDAGFQFALGPRSSLRISGTAGFGGDSTMTDFDWLDQTQKHTWTNRSIHDVTEIPGYLSLDAQFMQRVVQRDRWTLSALAGVAYTRVKWNALGGKFVYSTFDDDGNLIGFRDDRFELPDSEKGISYRQEWLAPYIGINSTWSNDRHSLALDVTASPLSWSWDRDDHWQRSLTFTETFKPGWRVTGDVTYSYRLTERASLTLSGGVESNFKVLGRTKIFDQGGISPVVHGEKDGAGADFMSAHGSLGVSFSF